MATETAPSVYETGDVAATGSFVCLECSFVVALSALDSVPECPTCGGSRFRRASMFEQPTLSEQPPVENDPEEPRWLRKLRAEIERIGPFLAFEDEDGEVSTIPVPEGWTRIGRSITADIRLDDPTVSRRHALIVKTDEGELDVQDLLGHYADELRATDQDTEAERILALAADASANFLMVVPHRVQADPSISTE